MPVQITGYGAINEIGGSKILIEDSDRRILLDFGMPFGRYGRYFDGVFIKERASRGLLDMLALGLLPPLRGVLRRDLVPALDPAYLDVISLPPTGRQKAARDQVTLSEAGDDDFWQHWQRAWPEAHRDMRREGRPAADAVILSHAHQDHIADTVFLDPDIAAVSTRVTAFISKVLADTGMAGQGAPYCNPYALDAGGLLGVPRGSSYRGRPWRFVDGEPGAETAEDVLQSASAFWGSSPASKGLEVQPCNLAPSLVIKHWPVDHSLFGAAGYAVETAAGWVAYTGDMRMHGKNGRQTIAFAQALQALRPAALLCEGTRLAAERPATTEAEVHDACLRQVQAVPGQMVVADFAARNIERLETFIDIATQTRRQLLVQPKDAYLLRAICLADADMPDWMAHPSVALYADPKSTERNWETLVRRRYAQRMVNHLIVAKNPGDYILAFSLTDIADMLDIAAVMGSRAGNASRGIYLFSNSAAYDDEQKVDLERLWNWVDHLGLRMIGLERPTRNEGGALVVRQPPGFHSSGHAGQQDLLEFVRTVAPRTLIPIHTEHAELWPGLLSGTGIKIIMPQFFKPIVLG